MNIAVLQGGPSAERAVSLRSGAAVAAALAERGHNIISVDPNPNLDENAAGASDTLDAAERYVSSFDWRGVDIAFNALHGPFGEDGRLQRVLDVLGVAYTGSGAAASRLGFHKSLAKARFREAGVPSPRAVVINACDSPRRLQAAAESLGYPVVIKPDAQGSSLGVAIVRTPEEVVNAAARCFCFGPEGLLEEYVAGTEWTVPVWDDEVLPVIQVVPAEGFYDYRAKYSDDRTEYRFETDPVADAVAAAGLRAAKALGMAGLSRADLRVDGQGRPLVLEVNSSPGMTDHSLVPKAAARLGMSLGELCERECRRAIARRRPQTLP